MNTNETSLKLRLKVGIFTVLGILLIGGITVYVNDRPFWWRSCQLVNISIEDATGLKMKSPVRSLGIQIGFLRSVELSETHVSLGICITAPVEVLPSTRAYIRGEGFLGDKFVELKPVRYMGALVEPLESNDQSSFFQKMLDSLIPSAYAENPSPEAPASPAESPSPVPRKKSRGAGREIPVGSQTQDVQQLVGRVDSLVNEMTSLTTNLKQAINPEELRNTMKQLNKTLENASKTLAPEGGLNQTAQRTLAKLEDAIEQLRSVMTRVNRGEGSVGKLLNDPTYADEIHEAIRNVNRLLSKVGGVRFVVDIGGEEINGYDVGRGWFQLSIWPQPTRYYRLGISVDPRGRRTSTTTTVTAGGVTTQSKTVQVEETGVLFTAMVGKVFFDRIDLSVGALHGDAAGSVKFYIGPNANKESVQVIGDTYTRTGFGVDERITLSIKPWLGLYFQAGLESTKLVDGHTPYFYGAGVSFDDDDIKLLFALR